jgi:hypothetical protein
LIITDQEISITVVESTVCHGRVAQENMNCNAMSSPWISSATNGVQALDKINLSNQWHIKWTPTHLKKLNNK